MKILITGGFGKIGTLINSLLSDSIFEVDNYDLKNGDDIFDRDNLQKRIEGAFAVIHLAAIPHPFHVGKTEKDYWKLNLEGTQEVFNTAKNSGVKRFLFSSSGCVYGFWGGKSQPNEFPIKEDNYLPKINEGQTIYGATKIACEEFLKTESSDMIKTVALRLESPNKNQIITEDGLTTLNYLNAKGLQEVGTLHRFHFWACVSKANFKNIILNSLTEELLFQFDVFNVNNPDVDSKTDHVLWLRKQYPHTPIHLSGNDALISIEKAKMFLHYKPQYIKQIHE